MRKEKSMKAKRIKSLAAMAAIIALAAPAILYAGHGHKKKTGTVTGTVIELNSPISFTTPTAPAGAISLGNLKVRARRPDTISSGTYTCTGLKVGANGTLTINASSGPINLYCSGAFDCAGTLNVTGNIPSNFHLYMVNSSSVTLSGDCYAVIDAPASAVTLNSDAQVFGSCIGGSISMGAKSAIHFDQALGSNGTADGGISQVQ
jgi:hypothetical protein